MKEHPQKYRDMSQHRHTKFNQTTCLLFSYLMAIIEEGTQMNYEIKLPKKDNYIMFVMLQAEP